MIIDCHYHLEERVSTRAELLKQMDRAGVEKTALMGSLIGPFREPPRFLLEILQKLLENRRMRGLGRLLVSNFTRQGEIKILGRPYQIYKDPENAPVFDAIRENPGRFVGWVFVNPRGKKNQLEELNAYKDMPGFIGVKAHPFWHHYAPGELLPAAEILAGLGKPLLIHRGFGEEGDIDVLLREAPGLKLILAHAGFPDYSDMWKQVSALKDVYFDLSQTAYVSEKAIRDIVAYLGPDRILFGTDGPSGFHDEHGKCNYGFIKRRIEMLFPQESIRRKILGENFAGITGTA